MQQKILKIDKITSTIIKLNPPHLNIIVDGETVTLGWVNPRLVPRYRPHLLPENGVYEFDFVADPPTEPTGDIITKIRASYIFQKKPSNLKKIIVHSASNSLEKVFSTGGLRLAETTQDLNTAIGYSSNFSFDEAFQDALHQLPQPSPSIPDSLRTVKVVETGAQFGGIAGFHHLFVLIEEVNSTNN